MLPAIWLSTAEKFGGVLVGGCLRDTLLGRKVKDVDIFVAGLTSDETDEKEYHDGNMLVEEFQLDGWDFQIIKHRYNNDPLEIVESFDIGLCKIAYSNGLWMLHSAFVQDMQNKTLTIIRKTYGYEDHLMRIKDKYPDYTTIYEYGEDLL